MASLPSSLPPSTPPRRPSPTKRAHSSPSPNSSPNPSGLAPERAAEAARVTRTKLMNEEREGSAREEVWATPETPPSPVEEDLRMGLGVAMGEEGAGEECLERLSGPEDQTRKLKEMPAALSSVLSRLSSQHHLSEYNALKRVVAAAALAAANGPPPPPVYANPPPPPTRPVVLQRSQSTPPLTLARPLHPLPANPSSQPPISHSRILRPSTPIPIPGRTDCTGTQSVPSLSRTSTPPASPRPATTLTPSLIRMGLDSVVSTPPSRTTELAMGVKENRLAEALTEALKSEMARPVIRHGLEAAAPVVVKAVSVPTVGANGLLPGMRTINGVPVKTSASHPMNISAVVPPEFLPLLSSHLLSSSSPESPFVTTALDSHPSETPFVLSPPALFDLWDIIATPPSHPLLAQPAHVAQPALGNFFLSSCPGKKVRMDGVPVKGGRSAICRDVGMDLARAKQEGVRMVICCLDDQELGFLGAPWEEYSAAATSLSLAVIRIPMVEGFAPPSPAILDAHLTRVLRSHTLKGEAVLAHCRGGIGRAGLVACCWMIKIGFIPACAGEGLAEAMRVVERVIDVIRRRRSIKAIETPHQVGFLLEYVGFLQQNASVVNA